jgi:hypothetical protein
VADPELTRILSQLVKRNATNRLPNMNQVSGLSAALLSSTGVQNPYKTETPNTEDVRGPGVVNRVLDIMSRPLYTVLNPVNEAIKSGQNALATGGNFATSVAGEFVDPENYWRGLSGQDKTTGRDILDSSGLAEDLNGPAKFAVGLGIDVLADPLTYVGGVGLFPKLGKAAKTSAEALSAVEKGTSEAARPIAEEIARRAAKQADDLKEIVPTPGMPAPKPGDPPRLYQAGPGPVGGLESFSAGGKTQIADDIGEKTLQLDLNQSVPMKALPAPTPVRELPLNVQKLNKQIATAKSPVIKNVLRKEVEKLQAGVDPADIFTAARNTPNPFPEITINPRWMDAAAAVAEKFLKNNRLKDINHVGQSNLYNSILNAASKVRKDRRAFHVLQMLRVAENHILNAGRVLTDAEGISVRLSDVANLAGGPRGLNAKLVDDFRKARPSQWVENTKAFTTPQVASEILDPVVETARGIAPKINTLPPSQTVMVGSPISKALTNLARQAGASAVEAKTAKAFIDDLFSVDRDALYSVIEREARNLVRQSSTGIVDSNALHVVSNSVYKSLGANPKVLGREIQQNKVVEGVMTKFATWWGAKDLKPFSREYIDTARNVAAAFADTIRPLVAGTKPSQREAAWAVATGKRAAVSPDEQQLADQFRYITERLMGTHGITDNAESVLYRSGTLLKELNDELPAALKLIDKRGTDALGRSYDYTKGQWMHSWKEWNVKEPAEALYQLTRALQMVTRKNAMWDDAAVRWGMPVKTAEFQYPVKNIPRLAGSYFPKQIADQLTSLQNQLERDIFKVPHKSVEIFDKVQRMWKSGVTIYSPSHHIRNLNGDIYLAALDGVVSPKPYFLASKVMHAFPTKYKDLESVFNIMDPRLRDSALRARPGNVVVTTKRGDTLTAEQLYQAAEGNGLFVRAAQLEELIGDSPTSTFGTRFQPFGGKVNAVASRTSELRDHWVRMAHFIDLLSKSKSPLPVAIEQAVRRVKKFHPDGTDLTGFEQNILRRVIPFYSWMRKATPLVFEGAIMRPHISLAFPKAMANMQLATGIESEGPGDPFPMDQMFPEWLREKGIGPVLQPGSGLGRDANWRGDAPGYTIINPTNPFTDQVMQAGSPGKTILSGLTPAARIPLELLTGQTTLGIPLDAVEGGVPGHLAQQIPPVGIGMRLTGATRDNEEWNPEQLINWLTSAGVTGTGPYQSQAQTEIRAYLQEIAKKNRGDYR